MKKIYLTYDQSYDDITYGPVFLEQEHAEKYCKVNSDYYWNELEVADDPGELHSWWHGSVHIYPYQEELFLPLPKPYDPNAGGYAVPNRVSGYVPMSDEDPFAIFRKRYDPPVEGKVQPPEFGVHELFGFEPGHSGIEVVARTERTLEQLRGPTAWHHFSFPWGGTSYMPYFSLTVTGPDEQSVRTYLSDAAQEWLKNHRELEIVEEAE